MRQAQVLVLLLFINLKIYSQKVYESLGDKPVIDTSVFEKWPFVSDGKINDDGKYISYVVQNYGPRKEVMTVIQSSDKKWETALFNVKNLIFSSNNKNILYQREDSLFILKLGTQNYSAIPNVNSFQLIRFNTLEWLVYSNKNNKNLIVYNLHKRSVQLEFGLPSRYFFSPDGRVLVLHLKSENENRLALVDVSAKKIDTIWQSMESAPEQVIFDNRASKLAFIVKNSKRKSIWYYEPGTLKAYQITKDEFADSNCIISRLERFSKDGNRLFYMMEKKKVPLSINSRAPDVNIWSYNDPMIYSEQLANIKNGAKTTYFSVLDLKSRNAIQLQRDFERISTYARNSYANDELTLVLKLDARKDVSSGEGQWNPAYVNSTLYLVSMKDGYRKKLPWKDKFIRSTISPNGKYVLFQNDTIPNYLSYEVSSGVIRNITKSIKEDITSDNGYKQSNVNSLIRVAGWLKEDKGVLIYDRYDIWLVDPSGLVAPKNLTNGYGKKNRTILRIAASNLYPNGNLLFDVGDIVLLAAFNERTKENGYYQQVLGKNSDPKKLLMENCLYTNLPLFSNFDGNLIKANNANAWLMMHQTAMESPNYYFTKDFKNTYRISNINPEKKWNWLTAELHSWSTLDNDTLQGILYKPENFNPGKKYPVIFYYYRQLSNELNLYKEPGGAKSEINIPWFVSRGYLVFAIDIHHSIPHLKESVLSCVLSAATYIKKYFFVDSLKIGIQGHSFGGLETGYLFTNTDIFAAACAGSGYYNLINDVGTILPHGLHRETSETHMGGSLWEKTNEFIKNSPIFDLDKVSTPVLLMTGTQDGQVPHQQTLELFLGLRRLGKKVWMLSYDNEGHILAKDKNILDYTLRMTQFFDFYLKNGLPPKWMTNGLSSESFESSYELESNIVIP